MSARPEPARREPARPEPLLPRVHRLAGAAWATIAAGASLGFIARDLLGLGQPWVALGWCAGAALGVWLVWRGRSS